MNTEVPGQAAGARESAGSAVAPAASPTGRPAGADGAHRTGAFRVRVMSYNVGWDGWGSGDRAWSRRRELLGSVIEGFEPDSVGLQEPSSTQIRDLTTALPQLVGTTDPSPILYRGDRFRLADGGRFLLSAGTRLPGSERFCYWLRLIEEGTGRAYYHFNVHFDHRIEASRRSSAVRLTRGIAARRYDDPFVVTGDFNAGEDSVPMGFLLRGQGLAQGRGDEVLSPLELVDTFRVVHPQATEVATFHNWSGRRRGPKIDYVLAQAHVRVLSADIVGGTGGGPYASDHYPVTAVLEWDDPEGQGTAGGTQPRTGTK